MENKKTPRKRKVLDLTDRVKVIERHNKGETAIAISLSLGCGKTQIQEIVNDKEYSEYTIFFIFNNILLFIVCF